MRSLRARLLLSVALLLAAGIVVIDVATVVSLRTYLTNQVDHQLEAAGDPLLRRVGPIDNERRPEPPPSDGRGPGRGIGLSEFYIEIRRSDGSVESQVPSALRGADEPVPELTPEVVADRAGTGPFTLSDQNGQYRVIVVSAVDGSGTVAIAAPLESVDDTIERVIAVEVIATATALVVLLAVGWAVIRRDMLPLENIAGTASKIAQGDLSLRAEHVDERSEVGRLGQAFNKMLEEIETSFAQRERSDARLRRFVADASHELRTPLTAVRGYAEMYRTGAVGDDEHLAHVMQRIESEAKRMGLVVEDLMLLARLDQHRPLDDESVDLTRVVSDAVGDARATDTTREITFDAGSEHVAVRGDQARLAQVMTNLLSNAVNHTPEGTPVAVTMNVEDGSAVVTVADQGPGLSAEQAEQVFERFYRADAGRARSVGGSGLGLSIVEALVKAHNGAVSVSSTPGQGATFTVRLPAEQR